MAEIGGRSIRELRVVDLKKELEARSLSKTGSKKDLVERLKNVSICSSGVWYFIYIKTPVKNQTAPFSLHCRRLVMH